MIVYSPQASLDLQQIMTDVYQVSGDADTACKYAENLVHAIEAREKFPKSGKPLYACSLFTGYYFVIFKAYLGFYRPTDSGLEVDRILPAKSDYIRTLFFPKG